jgi:tripartite-type tricarboxylate transporter receptor subunit TctC
VDFILDRRYVMIMSIAASSAFNRRALLLSAAATAITMRAARGDGYPARPIELIVPFAAGGGTDLLARLLADGLAKRLGRPFVAVNRPGGNTNLGTLSVVRATPDGYTLLMASVGLAANPSLYKKLGFDPRTELAPISLLANSPTVLVVPRALPVDSLATFVAYAKARPGELNYGSYGAGSGPHLATELFQSMTGVSMVHVPYSGGAPAALGVMTGQVQALFASVLPVLGMLRGDKVKAIALASDRRSALLPDVPTFAEGGLDYNTGTWFGLLAPAKTDGGILNMLHRAIVATLDEPSVRATLAEQGAEVIASSPAQFAAFVADETERLARVIHAANIRLD